MGAYDLITTDELIAAMRMSESDFEADALVLYHDETGAPSTATVAVSNDVLGLDVDSTPDPVDLTLAANDTLGELESVLNAKSGWVANKLLSPSLVSANISNLGTTSALGETLAQTLRAVDLTYLSQLIEGVTSRIENYLERGILSRSYTKERYSFRRGSRVMQLEQWPVTAVAGLWLDRHNAITVSNSASSLLYAHVTLTSTTLTLYQMDSAGAETTVALTLADYNTIAEVAAAIDATGTWGATSTSETLPASHLLAGGPWSVISTNVILKSLYHPAANWNMEDEDGMIFFEDSSYAPGGLRKVFASYTAGYSETPDDLKQVAFEIAALAYDGADNDKGLESERIGKYEYTNADVEAVAKAPFTAEQQVVLNGYKRARAL